MGDCSRFSALKQERRGHFCEEGCSSRGWREKLRHTGNEPKGLSVSQQLSGLQFLVPVPDAPTAQESELPAIH